VPDGEGGEGRCTADEEREDGREKNVAVLVVIRVAVLHRRPYSRV
jgi:hypothetical protein